MAKRKKQSNNESTVLKVAFILSVMTSIGLLIGFTLVFQSVEAEKVKTTAAEDKEKVALIKAANYNYISQTIQPMVGIGTIEERDEWNETENEEDVTSAKGEVESVEQAFEAFKISYPGLVPAGTDVNYVTVAKALSDRNKTLLNEKKQLQVQVAALNKQMVALRDSQRTDTATQFTDTQAKITTAVEDLATFRADRQATSAGIDAAKQKHTQALAAKDQEIANRDNQIADAQKTSRRSGRKQPGHPAQSSSEE